MLVVATSARISTEILIVCTVTAGILKDCAPLRCEIHTILVDAADTVWCAADQVQRLLL